jgi:hypothetical protein
VSVIHTFLASVGMFGAIIYLPLFIQGVLSQTATNSGAIVTPMMLGFHGQQRAWRAVDVSDGPLQDAGARWVPHRRRGDVPPLLSRMTLQTDNGMVVRNMMIIGLGSGVMMTVFTIAVQNAFPLNRLGEVTSSVQFFRSIGGTIGVAIFGTVMVNLFQSAMGTNLPQSLEQVILPDQQAPLRNPQLLLAPEATAGIRGSFTALGPQGQELFNQLMLVLRQSLDTAITELFAVGVGVMLLGFVVSLLLHELPLRKSHQTPEAPEQTPVRLDPQAVGEQRTT